MTQRRTAKDWTTYFFIYLAGFVTYPLLVMINVWRIWL